MNSLIYNPLEEYEKRLRETHLNYTKDYFEELVKRSLVNVEENRATVKEYEALKNTLKKLKRKLNLLRFLRVIMIITLILIPLVILKTTPKIKAMREEIEKADNKADELLRLANNQMLPLNQLFTSRDALNIIEKTIPSLCFAPHLSVKQELDMKTNFDFQDQNDEQSTLDTLSGSYNENPFLFENRLVHTMGTETYHGYKTISWTEYYTDSNGKRRSRRRTETLHATVTKPKPFYSTQVVLCYGSQGAPDLSFSRDASHLELKSESQLERHIKRGEKKLKKKTDKAISENKSFMNMSNTDFEVLFDALDRNDEVQFRTLFTPLAQTNMTDLILSKTGYGDDFNFFKNKRMNKIVSNHSQGRSIILTSDAYPSYSYDIIESNFTTKNVEYFKAVYFDFAPIWAIPAYHERPVHSLKPLPDYNQLYSVKESEVLANMIDYSLLVHPDSKTQAILKSEFVRSENKTDETRITAYSYDSIPRVDVVSVYGGDGRFHNVSVPWDEYIPLEATNTFFITSLDNAKSDVVATKNGLCIMK